MEGLPKIRLLIATVEQFIEGDLIIPDNMKFDNNEPNNILFYIINSGLNFISLKNCEIKDRKNLAFRPDKSPQLHVNISCIMTMQIIEILPDDYEYEDYYDEEDEEENENQPLPQRPKSRVNRRR